MRPLSSRAHDLYPFIGRGFGMPGDRFLPCPGCGSLLTGETGERLLWECRYCRAVFLVAEEVAEYRVPE